MMELQPQDVKVGQQHFHLEITTEDGVFQPFGHPDLEFHMPVYSILFDDAEEAFRAWDEVSHLHLARFLGDPADLHAEERAEVYEYWMEETEYADDSEIIGTSVDGGSGMEYHLYECYGCQNVTNN
jgi:hypothetical protein